jgi:cytosine deaminase
MLDPFASLPHRYLLRNARVPAPFLIDAPSGMAIDRDGAGLVDVLIDKGRITAVTVPETITIPETIDLDGRHVWPHLIDVHTHLDKGHTADRTPNATGTAADARMATAADRVAYWRRDDLLRRMDFGLRTAEAHGVAAIRTHLDSHEGQSEETWAAFVETRERWSSRLTLQGVAMVPLDAYAAPHGRSLADLVAKSGGILGGVTRAGNGSHEAGLDGLDDLLDILFTFAGERNLDVDLHVDEAAVANALAPVARATIRHGYEGRVTCGHCCSLALLEPTAAEALITLVRSAGISIVTLPPVNMYLQDREAGRTPRWRGVTPVTELRAAGVRVAAAGDNCRDPFYAYGDHDMLDTFRQAARICHLDHPIASATELVGPGPAGIMRLPNLGTIGVGNPAHLIIMQAWSMDQVMARPHNDRIVLRNGVRSMATPPSYLELRDIARQPPGFEITAGRKVVG